MKRCLIWLLAAALLLALGGCGGKEEPQPTQTTQFTPSTEYLPTTPPTEATVYPLTGYVTATTLNVRPTPDTTGYAIGGLKYGDEVTILGKEGDWYQISFIDGVGYVSAQYIQMDIPGAPTEAPTEAATEPTEAATEAPAETLAGTVTTAAEP